jgi:predicted Zn-dependent protease
VDLPVFLPAYYAPAFDVGGKQLKVVSQTSTNGVDQVVLSTANESIALSLENIKCDHPQGKAIFNNVLIYLNGTVSSNAGRFVEITDSEFFTEVAESNVSKHVFTYVLPASVQIWTYIAPTNLNYDFSNTFKLIRGFANKQRYQASLGDNVSMGHWGKQIHEYATQLISAGDEKEGLQVLEDHLLTMPFDYQAHVEFFQKTGNTMAATNSADIVFKNAETPELINHAAEFLGKQIPSFSDIPALDEKETGLQLILLPLPPCNLQLLNEAADCFERITGISVKIRRLEGVWEWETPDRIAFQRDCQSWLVRIKGRNIDFSNWTKEQYIQTLRSVAENEDALSKYYMSDFVQRIEKTPGQYSVDQYLDRLSSMLSALRSDDTRTMYVGVTEANIYSGDNNYLFSRGYEKGKSRASILSYYMMRGETLDAEYQSRTRLVERIAKELIPASLKQLGIPRSTDPTCPYSYSSGIDRLDQKTTRLSVPVKQALDQIRNPPVVP